MRELAMSALDETLDECLRAEARGDTMPLALRRFQERWGVAQPSIAIQLATTDILANYSKRFPSASSFIRVSRLCDIIGARLSPSRSSPAHIIPGSLGRHSGHSGLVRFSVDGQPCIQIPAGVPDHRARVAVAHELGHVLIHKRGSSYDDVTIRLPASDREEAVAEYAARLLLLPTRQIERENLAETAVLQANEARVTVHAAASRLGDPDMRCEFVRSVILWKLNSSVPTKSAVAERLTPAWRLCPGAFIPIGKCKARRDSLIADLARASGATSDVRIENVKIGSLDGVFRVHGFAWGSVAGGTRLILSVFETTVSEEPKPECGPAWTDSDQRKLN